MHVHFNLKKCKAMATMAFKTTWPLRPRGRADVGPRLRRRRRRRGCRGHILLLLLLLAEVQEGACPHPGAVTKQNKCFFRHVFPNQNSSVASQSENTSIQCVWKSYVGYVSPSPCRPTWRGPSATLTLLLVTAAQKTQGPAVVDHCGL